MSASNRLLDTAFRITLITIALAGAVLLVPLALQELGKTPEQRAEAAQRAEHEAQKAHELALLCAGERPIEDTPTADRCERARGQADLQAQQGMRLAAYLQAAVSFASFIGLVFTIYFAARAYREARRGAIASVRAARQTKRQADIAQAQLLESREPVLYASVEDWEVPTIPVGLPKITLALANLGDKLAIITGGRCDLYYGKPGAISKKQIMEDSQDLPVHVTIGAQPLRAGEVLRRRVTCTNLPFYLTDEQVRRFGRGDGAETLYVAGWAEYLDQRGNEYEYSFLILFHGPNDRDEPKGSWSVLPLTGPLPDK